MFIDRLSLARVITRPFLSASSLVMRSYASTRAWLHLGHLVPVHANHAQLPVLPPTQAGASLGTETLSRRALSRRVWALALPAIGEQLLALLVGLSDTFLTGHLSSQAMAQLGYTLP
jgi:hypothetical protein